MNVEEEQGAPQPRRILRRQEAFHTVMRQNSMEFDEANQETRQHSTDGLNFAEFCALVHQREDGKFTEKELRERFRALDVSGSGFIEKHEYLRFSLRDALARSVTRVMEIFSAWDENHDGQVSALEFRRAVRSLGFSDVSDTDIDQIFHEFDNDESGSVSQLELERKLKKYAGVLTEQKYKLRRNACGRKGAALAPSVKLDRESGRPVHELLRDALSDNAVRVIDLFRDWDENQDGLISKHEFAKAMAPLGIQVSKEEAGALFDAFDPDGSGAIEYRELDQLLRRRVDIGAEKRAALARDALPPSMHVLTTTLSLPHRCREARASARSFTFTEIHRPEHGAGAAAADHPCACQGALGCADASIGRYARWVCAHALHRLRPDDLHSGGNVHGSSCRQERSWKLPWIAQPERLDERVDERLDERVARRARLTQHARRTHHPKGRPLQIPLLVRRGPSPRWPAPGLQVAPISRLKRGGTLHARHRRRAVPSHAHDRTARLAGPSDQRL